MHADDAYPGAKCVGNKTSALGKVNLKMVDDDGDVLIDDGKTFVCRARDHEVTLSREVFFESPENCKDSAVPTGNRPIDGAVATTVSVPGGPDFETTVTVKCRD
jgi:hypothetical protein